MRYFQKLMRRADIPVAYSEGFSPHQILSFTPPLPLGMESFGEYADVGLTGSVATSDALEALRAQSVPEIGIMSFRGLPDKCENAMAAVAAASYSVKIKDISPEDIKSAVQLFMSSPAVTVTRKTKKSIKDVDIRPLVYEMHSDDECTVSMLISSGSTDNLKPELVLSAMFPDTDDAVDLCTGITRCDQYTLREGKLISLDDIGYDIVCGEEDHG